MIGELIMKSEFHVLKERKGHPHPVALLIHGMSSTSRTWDDTVVYLMRHGFNVVTVELEGHGDSTRLDKYSFNLWIDSIVNQLYGFKVTSLDLMVGHSLGGLLAAGVAEVIPTRKVLFIDPLLAVPPAMVRLVIKRMLRLKVTASLPDLLDKFPNRDPQLLLHEYEAIRKWDVKCVEALKPQDGWAIVKRFFALESKPESVLVRPASSMLIPKRKAKFFAEHGIRVVTVENVGHGVHLDAPEEFQQILSSIVETEAVTV